MDITKSVRLEEAINEALYIARELGFPNEELERNLLTETKVDPKHLQLARKYRKLYATPDFILMKLRN